MVTHKEIGAQREYYEHPELIVIELELEGKITLVSGGYIPEEEG